MVGIPTGSPTFAPTAGLVRIGVNQWIVNSTQSVFVEDQTPLAWANIAVGLIVILSTAYLKEKKINRTRALTDLCACGLILSGILYITWYGTPRDDIETNAFYIDLGISGIASMMVQFPDDMIFFLGYWHIYKKKVQTLQLTLLVIYIIFINYLSWVPQYTIFPFLFNTNSPSFQIQYTLPGNYIYTYGEVFYFIAMSASFLQTLFEVNIKRTKRILKRYQLFGVKCCVHMLSSISAVVTLQSQEDYIKGLLIYNLHIMCSLHLLFNMNTLEFLFRRLHMRKVVAAIIENEYSRSIISRFSGRETIGVAPQQRHPSISQALNNIPTISSKHQHLEFASSLSGKKGHSQKAPVVHVEPVAYSGNEQSEKRESIKV